MKFKLWEALLAGSILATANVTMAGLIQADYLTANDNLAVYDENTGLTWLDTALTSGMLYADVGNAFPGWRVATNTEVESLFSGTFSNLNYGANGVYTSTNFSSNTLAEASNFITTFGYAGNNYSGSRYSLAFYFDEDLKYRAAGVRTIDGVPYSIFGPEWAYDITGYETIGHVDYGVFMVKGVTSTVPEPSTLAILGLGLIGLRYRKKG
ncbi:PEP-CTERM sorting domain-containing protein [Cognaticolwellia mytili]|uniref:PEP-CTERM sorting domain-containing protein n=1 Tax=Cognaticolwellia mytili TaxID=1888913 RepID=UPI000A16F261|nr:PEP-CTERM sorting domain-containing protein [Cognaticolwellia mytili]